MTDLKCSIIMPISVSAEAASRYPDGADHFDHVLNALFMPAVRSAGFTPVGPVIRGSDVIQAGIIRNIEQSDLVLCDMSTLNPNVFFEFGIRTALDKPVCVVKDDRTDVPFDTGIVKHHVYDSALTGWSLAEETEDLVQHIKASYEPEHGNALWRFLALATRASPRTEPPSDAEQFEFVAFQLQSFRDALYQVLDVVGPRPRDKNPEIEPGPHPRNGKLEKLLENKVRAMEPTNTGNYYKTMGDYPTAIGYYDLALRIDPQSVGARLDKAYCVKRTALPDKYDQALNIVEQALRIDAKNSRALYNRACYKALLDRPAEEVLADLEKAFDLGPFYRDIARNDSDLSFLADDERFKKLIEPEEDEGKKTESLEAPL